MNRYNDIRRVTYEQNYVACNLFWCGDCWRQPRLRARTACVIHRNAEDTPPADEQSAQQACTAAYRPNDILSLMPDSPEFPDTAAWQAR